MMAAGAQRRQMADMRARPDTEVKRPDAAAQ